jgi:hypothetical protein
MRSAEIVPALAIALTLAGCTKRQSLYIEPGREAPPPSPTEGGASRVATAAGPPAAVVPDRPRTKAAP